MDYPPMTEINTFPEKYSDAAYIDLLATVLNIAPNAVITIDHNQNILIFNQGATNIFGYEPEEVIGKPLNILMPKELGLIHRDHILKFEKSKIQNRNMAERKEIFGLRKNGELFPAEASIAKTNWDGQSIFTVIIRDITERKKIEEKFVNTNRTLKLFIEYSPAAIAMFDRDMNYLAASRRYKKDLNLKPHDLTGKNHYDIFPELPEKWKEVHKRCLAGAVEKEDAELFIRSDGSRQWVKWEIHPWYENNNEIGGIIIFSEIITKQVEASKRIESQIQRVKALQTIDMAIANSLDLHLTLQVVVETATLQLKVDAVAVLLLNNITKSLTFAAGYGFRSQDIAKKSLQLGEGYAGYAALERQMVHIPDFSQAKYSFVRYSLIVNEGFIEYYGIPLIVKGEIKGVLEVFHRSKINPDSDWLTFFETLAGQAAIAINGAQVFTDLQRSNNNLTIAYDATIEGWSRAMDLRDKETEGHTQRVTSLTLDLARVFGLSDEELVHIRRGALLHDMGKLGIPDNILLKPGKLTDEEWVIMKKHPLFAYDMLFPIPYLRPALDIPYCHHEKWDGTGYPRGLQGQQIPLAARLFAVIDVWDALTSDRPYREAWPKEKVINYIQSLSGSHFDPQVVDAFLDLLNKI